MEFLTNFFLVDVGFAFFESFTVDTSLAAVADLPFSRFSHKLLHVSDFSPIVCFNICSLSLWSTSLIVSQGLLATGCSFYFFSPRFFFFPPLTSSSSKILPSFCGKAFSGFPLLLYLFPPMNLLSSIVPLSLQCFARPSVPLGPTPLFGRE